MRLFLKHIARSIKNRATQPVILLLVLILATSVTIFSVGMNEMIMEELNDSSFASYGSADLVVSLNGSSTSRFMFADRAEELLGQGTKAVGCFELSVFYGENKSSAFCGAVDFYDVEEVFDLEFSQSSPITQSTVGESIFVTEKFAEENNLSPGSSIKLEIAGVSKVYKVVGISKAAFMSSYDILADVSGIIEILTSTSPILSALGESFKPAGSIYIDLPEGMSIDQAIRILESDSMFADRNYVNVAEASRASGSDRVVRLPMQLSVMLSAILTLMVSYTCFYILSLERSEENKIFLAAGARPRMLVGCQYLEAAAYWLVGGALGFLLSIPMTEVFVAYAGFEHVEPTVSTYSVIFSEICVLAVIMTTVAVFNLTSKQSHRKKNPLPIKNKAWIILSVVYLISYALVFVLPADYRIITFSLSTIFAVFLIFAYLPKLMQKAMLCIDAKLQKSAGGRKQNQAFRYAVKNLYSVKILHNTTRLVTIATTAILLIFMAMLSYFGNVNSTREILNGDYIVINSTDRCYEKLTECNSIDSIYRLYMDQQKFDNGVKCVVLSSDSQDAFTNTLPIENIPEGSSAIITDGYAKTLSIGVGDSMTLALDNMVVEIQVAEVVNSSFQFILMDCEHFGLSYNMLLTKGADGVENNLLLDEITEATAIEMAAVIPADQLVEATLRGIEIMLRSAIMLMIVISVFILIGMLNNLVESYRSRADEFSLYRFAGMSGKTVRRMKIYELMMTFGFGIALGLVAFALQQAAMNYGLKSIGVEMYENLKYFF